MNSLIALWIKLAHECASMCCTCADRDIKTVTARVKHEGSSFLTITLPSFCSDFERSLSLGAIDPTAFTSFSKHRGLPRFMGGFLDQVFDRCTGQLLIDPSVDAIRAIRQLTLVFGKMFLPCSVAREDLAMLGFIECENDISRQQAAQDLPLGEDFSRVAKLLFHRILKDIDWKIFDLELYGKHGPGATADKLTGNGKFSGTTWTRRLESILPFGDLLLVNRGHRMVGDSLDVIEPEMELPVKVISVPKTQKTPRIIAIEPTCMQFAQQAISHLLVQAIEKDILLSNLIGFRDQVPNQDLAKEGSFNGNLATLDLSEASDRVSCSLVELLVGDYPCLHRAVLAARSYRADVPGHGVITLAKYASMGSALTFPLEAMVFTTLSFLGIERELNRPLTQHDLYDHVGSVRVYGDDIIVPVDTVRRVTEVLSHFGSRVNLRKSFWTGKFRESCGKEYYDGHDVSVVKLRRNIPTERGQATEVIGLISFRNLLYKSGYWGTCQWLDEGIRKLIYHFPVVLETSPVLGRHSFLGYESEKMCPHLHRPLVKGLIVDAVSPKSQLGDHGALFKCLSPGRIVPFDDDQHLMRAGRPRCVNTKTGWAPPY